MRRWLRKFVQVFAVIALGAIASIPFRRLPPPRTTGPGNSADRIVLQNEGGPTVQEAPLQVAPAAIGNPSGALVGDSGATTTPTATSLTEETRTASVRSVQTSRKDLPNWNSKLESNSPPPPLPDTFAPTDSTGTGGANPISPPDGSSSSGFGGDTSGASRTNDDTTGNGFSPGRE